MARLKYCYNLLPLLDTPHLPSKLPLAASWGFLGDNQGSRRISDATSCSHTALVHPMRSFRRRQRNGVAGRELQPSLVNSITSLYQPALPISTSHPGHGTRVSPPKWGTRQVVSPSRHLAPNSCIYVHLPNLQSLNHKARLALVESVVWNFSFFPKHHNCNVGSKRIFAAGRSVRWKAAARTVTCSPNRSPFLCGASLYILDEFRNGILSIRAFFGMSSPGLASRMPRGIGTSF